jgi:O-antigen ligase
MVAFTAIPSFRGAIAGIVGRDVTLTGRTLIWEQALGMGTNPVLGTGFASTWLTEKGMALADSMGGLSHAHNGYLETYLHSGWIGVLLLLAVLYMAGRNASRQLSASTVAGHLFIALFLSGLLYNYTEVAFNDNNIVGFALWLMAAQGGGLFARIGEDDEEEAPAEFDPEPHLEHAEATAENGT